MARTIEAMSEAVTLLADTKKTHGIATEYRRLSAGTA
jgi:hypothetical protein